MKIDKTEAYSGLLFLSMIVCMYGLIVCSPFIAGLGQLACYLSLALVVFYGEECHG